MPNFKAALFVSALMVPFQAQAQTACESYTIVSGDTLRLIAERVFGERDLSPVIFKANRSVVGGNPNNIEIGMVLTIPCDATANVSSGSGAINLVTSANTVVIENTETPESTATVTVTETPQIPVIEVPLVEDTPVEATAQETAPEPVTSETATTLVALPSSPSFVAAGMYPPFSEGEGKGMMTDIVRAAFGNDQALAAIAIDPVSMPFDPLMASSDPDVVLSFPWIEPGCDAPEFLSVRSAVLCENFDFSDKAYEIVMTFFVADRGGLAQVSNASDFDGKSICVPAQYPTNHLSEAGFDTESINIDRASSVAECMSKLFSGQVDVVNADYLTVEVTYAVLSSQSLIVENPNFTWIRSVHAIASKNNPAGLQTLAVFNDGLSRIKENGSWDEIVQPYLE